jgi:hypothetical protein
VAKRGQILSKKGSEKSKKKKKDPEREKERVRR